MNLNRSTIPIYLKQFVATVLVAALAFIGLAGISATQAQAGLGYKHASTKQKRQLKKVAASRFKHQSAWFVSKDNSPRFGIVCGKTKKGSFPGLAFKRTRGHWRFHKTRASGGLQTIIAVCS